MKQGILWLALSVLASTPVLAVDSYTIDSRHTFPSFEINHLGFSMQRGRFNQSSGTIQLDPEAGTGSMQIIVDAASIDTGLEELEAHLRGEDFFDTARYPKIVFSSNTLHFKEQQLVAVEGQLTLHGVTKPVTLTVDYFYCGINLRSLKNVCGANALATIKRSDFAVDKYAPLLADEVKIIIQVEAIKD
ncbi:MAG: YceI family protein [Methyloprofundus sp.]|nr:YceI family protein [Methyloprofundus sp.]MDT8425639.1 YceI family protein [Methyloprofundus sp.]